MSPPEVWGPAVWTLFHTLIEKMNPYAYPQVIGSMFGMIVRICKVLPCPECSNDASNFLAKIKLNNYKNKDEFRNFIYLFHNWVNAKKRKSLYNYSDLSKYSRLNLIYVINNFIAKYNTKGNMKLLAESFQRSFVVKDLIAWFKIYGRAFIIQPIITNYHIQINENQTTTEDKNTEKKTDEENQPTREDKNTEKKTDEENQPTREDKNTEKKTDEENQPTREDKTTEKKTDEENQPTREDKTTEKKTDEKEKFVTEEPELIVSNEQHVVKEKLNIEKENIIITDENINSKKINLDVQKEIIEEPVIIQTPKKKKKGKNK